MKKLLSLILISLLLLSCNKDDSPPMPPQPDAPFGQATMALKTWQISPDSMQAWLDTYTIESNLGDKFYTVPDKIPVIPGRDFNNFKIFSKADGVFNVGLIAPMDYETYSGFILGEHINGPWIEIGQVDATLLNFAPNTNVYVLIFACKGVVDQDGDIIDWEDCGPDKWELNKWQRIEVPVVNAECFPEDTGCLDNKAVVCDKDFKKTEIVCQDTCELDQDKVPFCTGDEQDNSCQSNDDCNFGYECKENICISICGDLFTTKDEDCDMPKSCKYDKLLCNTNNDCKYYYGTYQDCVLDSSLGCTETCQSASGYKCFGQGDDVVCKKECAGEYVNLNSNTNHCGSCNTQCQDGQICANGICTFCGNGVIDNNEQCDDANFKNDDGCSKYCYREDSYTCVGEPSWCEKCGDKRIGGLEECEYTENGPVMPGCDTKYCQLKEGYECKGFPPDCTPICGDGIIVYEEYCDDGNTIDGDGCSSSCLPENSKEHIVLCKGEPSVCKPHQCDSYQRKCEGDNLITCENSRWVTTECELGCNDEGQSAHCNHCESDEKTCYSATIEATCNEQGFFAWNYCNNGFYCLDGVCQTNAVVFRCGDGIVQEKEECDDKSRNDGDGCSRYCKVEDGWECSGNPSVCIRPNYCGNGVLDANEECDDKNDNPSDGCTNFCRQQTGWQCQEEPSVCTRLCGNGIIDTGESCDDAKISTYPDGCSNFCQINRGWECIGQPSVCRFKRGDGVVDSDEDCDDGNNMPGDGCDSGRQSGICGDARVFRDDDPTTLYYFEEECDDGNKISGDGCSYPYCQEEWATIKAFGNSRQVKYECEGQPSKCYPTHFGHPDVGGESVSAENSVCSHPGHKPVFGIGTGWDCQQAICPKGASRNYEKQCSCYESQWSNKDYRSFYNYDLGNKVINQKCVLVNWDPNIDKEIKPLLDPWWEEDAVDSCGSIEKLGVCGDGIVARDNNPNNFDPCSEEECDDANTLSGDGCSSTCQEEVSIAGKYECEGEPSKCYLVDSGFAGSKQVGSGDATCAHLGRKPVFGIGTGWDCVQEICPNGASRNYHKQCMCYEPEWGETGYRTFIDQNQGYAAKCVVKNWDPSNSNHPILPKLEVYW